MKADFHTPPALFPARSLTYSRYWQIRGLLAFGIYFFLSSYLPLLWDSYLSEWQLLDLSGLGPVSQFVIGLLVFEFVLYCWHRALHRFDGLWRVFHQMHHSAERLDTFGAFWFSPADMVGFTAIGSISLVLVVGIGTEATTAILLTTHFLAIFQHMNLSTPRWLGFLVQRPESHSYHHGVGLHCHNYADLPLFDMLFGTFANPCNHLDTGFYPGASERVLEMLMFKDIDQNNRKQEKPPLLEAA